MSRPMELELVPPELIKDLGLGVLAIWFTPSAKRGQLLDVGRLMMSPTTAFTVPGGRWLKIMSLVGLKINTPSEAIATLRLVQDEEQDRLLGTRDLTYQDRDEREAEEQHFDPTAEAIGYQEVS